MYHILPDLHQTIRRLDGLNTPPFHLFLFHSLYIRALCHDNHVLAVITARFTYGQLGWALTTLVFLFYMNNGVAATLSIRFYFFSLSICPPYHTNINSLLFFLLGIHLFIPLGSSTRKEMMGGPDGCRLESYSTAHKFFF